MTWIKENIPFVLTLCVGLVAWEFSIRYFSVPAYLLPAPTQIISKAIELWPTLLWHSWVTLSEVLLGFFIGASLGFFLACSMSLSRTLERIFFPFILLSQTFPKEAFAPLLLLWLGFGIWPKVAVAALISFFPLTINTARGITSVDPMLVDLLRSLSASRWKIFWKLRLPNSLPYLFTGLKMGAILSVIGAVVGEFVGSGAGLGHLIQVGNSQLSTDLVFAALIALGAISLGLFLIIEALEKLALRRHDRITYLDVT